MNFNDFTGAARPGFRKALTAAKILTPLCLLTWLASCGGDSDEPLLASTPPTANLTEVFTDLADFTQPVAMLQAPRDNTRWFVVERAGRVKVFQNVSTVNSVNTFIDLTSKVHATSGDETGLLGMAFHPNFPTDTRVFLSYTAQDGSQLVSRISSFRIAAGGATLNPTETVLLTVNQPEPNHNGGHLAFHPQDGYLYIGLGDGGGGGDQHTANGPNGNAQSLTTLLGKMLRIDVDGAAPYTAPTDNPHAANPSCGNGGSGAANCPEIYAYGFRNPWRWSFDRDSGDLWAGDVGQDAWEEIDQVQKNGNYGWRYREGAHCYNPSTNCPTADLIEPVAEYGHSLGISVTGGYVYRGAQNTTLKGRYLFGDFGSGRIWAWIPDRASQPREPTQLLDSTVNISSFGEANDGELYVVGYNGKLYRLTF